MAEMESLVFNPSVFAPGQAQAQPGPAEPESRDVPFSSIRFLPGLSIQVSLAESPQQRYSVKLIGMLEGNADEGYISLGTGIGNIHSVKSVAEVVDALTVD